MRFLSIARSAVALAVPALFGQLPAALFYDHGDPTPHEQLMLEMVNRARADPGAEAARLDIQLNEAPPAKRTSRVSTSLVNWTTDL